MKVFVSGASGAIGKQLVPRLVAAGHQVTGSTTTASKRDSLRALGAEPVVLDLLDQEAVGVAVGEAEPDAIIHEATALAEGSDPRHFDRDFAITNRLRTEGTDNLLAAGRAAGVERFLAQGFAGWSSNRTGGEIKSETDPLDPNPPEKMRSTMAAFRHLEKAVTGAGRHRPALRRLLRARHELAARSSRRDDRPRPQAQIPVDRGRRRSLVVHPCRRRGRRHGQGARDRRARDLQRGRRRTRRGRGVAAGGGPRGSERSRLVACRAGSPASPPASSP